LTTVNGLRHGTALQKAQDVLVDDLATEIPALCVSEPQRTRSSAVIRARLWAIAPRSRAAW